LAILVGCDRSVLPSVSVVQGQCGTTDISTIGTGGFDSPVALSAAGTPSGATASFNPESITGSGTSTLTFCAGSSAAPGTSTITVTGTSGSTVETATVSLTVTAAPTFTLSAMPKMVWWRRTHHLECDQSGGFNLTITLSALQAPQGVTPTWTWSTIRGARSTMLYFIVQSTATPGTYPITVQGQSGSLVKTTAVMLTVN
jgi:hypothetical protein